MAAPRPHSGVRTVVGLLLAALFVASGGLGIHAPSAGDRSASVAPPHPGCPPCEATAVAPTRVAAAAIRWQNVTPEQFGDVPPASAGASLAYDAADHEGVWFGGCSAAGCAENETWLYKATGWVNDTGQLAAAPLPRFGSMMDYDPNARAVVLVGGHVESAISSDRLTNDSWEFSGGSWTEQPAPCATNTVACLSPESGGSFAFDANRSVNASVLFGGCFAFSACSTFDNETWWFNGTTGTWRLESAFPPTGAPSARVGAAMAYDPTLQALVLFGGTARCGTANCTEADTWTYAGGTWSNATAALGGTGPPPPPRVFGSLVYDTAQRELLLTGGWSSPGGTVVNSTYALACASLGASCAWTGPVPTPGFGRAGAAVATTATELDPMVVGGADSSGALTNATWVYSAEPDLNVAVSPSTPEVGRSVALNVSAVASVNATIRVLWGDRSSTGGPPGVFAHTYSTAGVENVTVALLDPNGSANIHYLQLIVHSGPAVTVIVLYSGIDVGVPDTFTAAPVLGNGTTPYNFTWNFGTGPVQYGDSVVHAFASPGTQRIVLDAVDALGLRTQGFANVTVAPTPTVAIEPQYLVGGRAVADSGVSTSLLANVTGGTVPFNFTWEFGDDVEGFGTGPSHSYDAAPVVRAVTVTLADAGGGHAESTTNLSVAPYPSISAIATSPSVPTAGGLVRFSTTLTGGVGPGTVHWTFGDGAIGDGPAANHSYASSGTYTATAWWNDSAGGSAVRSVNVTVRPFVSALTGFLLNPIVLSGVVILAAAAVALVVRARRRTEGRPSAPEPPAPAPDPESPPASRPPTAP